MADLYIDMDELRRTKASLTTITELLDRPCRSMAELPSRAAGHEGLRSRLEEFGSEWSYGIGKLGEFSASTSEALEQIEKTFTELDQELAQAFTDPAT